MFVNPACTRRLSLCRPPPLMSQKIRIENGTSGEVEYTSLARANFFVESKRAKWVSARCIRFLETDYRHVSATHSAHAHRLPVALAEDSGFATLDGLKHTPVIQPIRLLTGKRPAVPPMAVRRVEISRQFCVQSF